jgi:trk system potassium uptake protein TrkA
MYVVVAGGGMVGGTLVRKLVESNFDVVLIERDKQLCEKIFAETGAIVINGSASDMSVLEEAKIAKADIFVVATPSDADNLASTIMAKSFDVPEVIVRMHNPSYERAYHLAGANTILRVTDLLVNKMLLEIEKPDVQRVTTIGGGKADIFRMVVPEGAQVAGKSIREIGASRKFPSECRFIAVYSQENGEVQISRADHVINEGDELFIISRVDGIKAASDFISDTRKSIF